VRLRSPRSKAYMQVSTSLYFALLITLRLWAKGQFLLFLQILVPRKYFQRRVLELLFEGKTGKSWNEGSNTPLIIIRAR
jgi:hypothetical protein